MPKQILLVDDSVTIHRMVEITFAQEDFAITAVKSADEGLERAKQLRPDIVLADAGLPGKTGYDLCGALRQDSALAKTACLILTGNFSPYDEGKGSAAGADGFVVKPFETQGLLDKVKDAIARRTGGEAPKPVAAAPAPAPVPVAAAPAPAPAPVAAKPGVESLSKPLSTIAAETSARVPINPARPAPMPVPTAPQAPVAAAPAGPRPTPKATLMGIPAVNPAALGVPPAATPPAAKPVAPAPAPAPAPVPAAPSAAVLRPSSTGASGPIQVTPPAAKPAPAPAPAPAPVAAAPRAAQPTTLPSSVPQMPRPSLVPGVAQPRPAEPQDGIGAVVRQVAERTAAAVPAAMAAKGPEYEAIAKLSREVIEQVVWEVVPELAETIIRAELDRLVRERQNA